MADPALCSCGLRFRPFNYPDGTSFELEASPHIEGAWAIVDGRPVFARRLIAVQGKAPLAGERLPGFEQRALYRSHYVEHAKAMAARVQALPGRKASGS